MDKREEGLRAGVAEMRSVAQRLIQWADDLEASFQDQKAPEKEMDVGKPAAAEKRKKAGSGKQEAAAVEPAAAEEKKTSLTLPEVRAILAEKVAAGFGTQVKALIESFGAVSLKGVPTERYGELLDAVAGLGMGGDAGAG